MTPIDNQSPSGRRRDGQAIRAARASRTRMIRRRVIAGGLALFVATWLLIAVALASGHDPALSTKTTASATTTAAATPTTTAAATPTTATTATTTTPNTTTTTTGSSQSSGTSAVTTRQS